MPLVYVDTGVLIAAVRGDEQVHAIAKHLLAGSHEFASGDAVSLELLPIATFHQREQERAFYATFFASVARWIEFDPQTVAEALDLGCRFGLSAMDALHVASAVLAGADELVTAERPASRLLTVTALPVRSLLPTASAG